jgi:hypothetical protein
MEPDEQLAQDLRILRDNTWENRDAFCSMLVCENPHHVVLGEATMRILGWVPGTFIVACLLNDRSVLDE